MSNNYLEPTINLGSPNSTTIQSAGAYAQMQPETPFESFLTDSLGTAQALSFLAADGLAFANAENPSFGGTVVSTAISNFGNGATFGPSIAGSGYYTGGYGGYYGGAQNLPVFGGAGVTASYLGGSAGFGGGYGATVDGFSAGGIKQEILDEGLQQIILMAEVQAAARTLDTMSNVITEEHRANMNAIRNIRTS